MKKKPETIAKQLVREATNPDRMADAIVEIGNAMRTLERSRLTRRAVVILIKDETGVSIDIINRVLNAAVALDKIYLK